MTITLKNSTVLRAGATLRGSVPHLHPCGPNHFLICCSIYAAGGGITQVAVKVASEDFAAIIEMMSSVNPQRVKNLISQALTFDELDALRKAKWVGDACNALLDYRNPGHVITTAERHGLAEYQDLGYSPSDAADAYQAKTAA